MVRCSQEPSVFSLGKEVVKVINKTAKINEKKSIDLLKLINYKNKFSNDSHNESYTFFDFYFQNFAKNKVFITIRDMVEYIFMAVVVFLFKNKYSSLIIFIFKKIYKPKVIEGGNPIEASISKNSTIVKYRK